MIASRLHPEQPIVSVGAVVIDGDRVLLVKRGQPPLKGQWSLPGGAVETGETLQAAVAREVLEEIGVTIEVGPIVDVFDRIQLDETGRVRYHFVLIDFVCRPIAGHLRAESDVTDVIVADPAQLESYRLTTKTLEVIHKAVTNKAFT